MRNWIRLAVCAAVVANPLGSSVTARATPPTAYPNHRVNMSAPLAAGLTDNFGGNRQFEPTIAVDPVSGALVAGAIDFIDKPPCIRTGTSGTTVTGECSTGQFVGVAGVYTSTDGGQHWSQRGYHDTASTTWKCTTAVIHSLPGYCAQGLFSGFDPVIVFGPRPVTGGGFSFSQGARAYYVDLASHLLNPQVNTPVVTVARSDDDGTSWMAPVVAGSTTDRATQINDKDMVWADATATSPCFGNVYAAWDLLTNHTDANVEFSRSLDGGSTWSAAANVTPGYANNPNQPAGAVIRSLPDGTVVVVWQDFNGGGAVINSALSHDCGATFSAPRTVAALAPLPILPGSHFDTNNFPSMDVDSLGDVFVAWSTYESNAATIRFSRSTDGGLTWSSPIRLNVASAGQGLEPAVGAAPSGGRVVVSYLNYWAGGSTPGPGVAHYDVRMAMSSDGGQTFMPHQLSSSAGDPDGVYRLSLINEFIGDYTSIAVSTTAAGTTAYPIWTDARSARPCPAVDAYSASVGAGTPGPRPDPDVNNQCPLGFGNSDIYMAAVPL